MSSEPDPSFSTLINRLMTISLTSFSSPPSTPRPEPDPDHEPDPDRILLLNPLTQGMMIIGATGYGFNGFDSLFNDLAKSGQPPASQASIDGLSSTEIKSTEEIESLGSDSGSGSECVICLEEWRIGDVVNEMPCRHKFHGGCLRKWLKIHGSCPVCRFVMPVDDDDDDGKKVEGGSGGRRGGVWVTFAFGGRRSRGESEVLGEEDEGGEDGVVRG